MNTNHLPGVKVSGLPAVQVLASLQTKKKTLTLTANSQKTATEEMKLFKMTFAALGILAAIAIALGAYWHIFTLGACWLLVWAVNNTEY